MEQSQVILKVYFEILHIKNI